MHSFPAILKIMPLLLLFAAPAPGQQPTHHPDTLMARLAVTPSGDSRISLLYHLAIHFAHTDMPRARGYAAEAGTLMQRTTPPSLQGDVFYALTVTTMTIDSGIYYADRAIEAYAAAADSVNLAETWNLKAEILADYGRFAEALPFYHLALGTLTRRGLTSRAAYVISNIAMVYNDMHNPARSAEYSQQALGMFRAAADTNGIASTLLGMTEYYFSISDTAAVFSTIEEEIRLYRALKKPFMEAYAMSNLADALMDYRSDYHGALSCLHEALAMCDTTSANRVIHVNILRKIARAYLFLDKPERALGYGLQAVAATDTANSVTVMYNELLLLYIYIELNDSERAAASLERYRGLSDRMHAAGIEQAVADMQVRYETLEKENRILVLTRQQQKTRRLIIFMAASFAVAMFIALLLLRSWRDRRRLAEQKLRLVASESVIEGAERERRRMARDLHDGLGGLLTGLRFSLNSVKGSYETTTSAADEFSRALDLLDESIGELRRVARNMMPEALMRMGLNAALDDYCASLAGDGSTVITFSSYGGVFAMPARYEASLYRIAQELVNNAVRHSGATEVTVQVVYDRPRVHLTVGDNGCGFDVAARVEGTGLAGIRSRCESLGGTFSIDTAPGSGTEISAGFEVDENEVTGNGS